MAPEYSKSLFIFRRDLRLDDNIGLLAAAESSKEVILCFILDPRQLEDHEFKSDNALRFMLESLKELIDESRKRKGKLHLFCGRPEVVVKRLIISTGINAVFTNRDYTPFSVHRDHAIMRACREKKVHFNQYDDLLLHQPELVAKKDGKPYNVFTPFYKSASQLPVSLPVPLGGFKFSTKKISQELNENIFGSMLSIKNSRLAIKGGRSFALEILAKLKKFRNYGGERDYPAEDKTTSLSAHLKFGTCSIREVYSAIRTQLGPEHPLIRQLFWREFYTYIACNFPRVFGHSFKSRYETLVWLNDKTKYQAWCQGKTGFPIIDAGMRQLNTTGFMHNRVRMLVASFLTKDLHIDWRWGERYFAKRLVDYDPCINNGNWQWAASTGCDAVPYFRIFNPWIQQKRYDPDCLYIKTWIPELRTLSSDEIHSWHKRKSPRPIDYPLPIVNHMQETRITIDLYSGSTSQARRRH